MSKRTQRRADQRRRQNGAVKNEAKPLQPAGTATKPATSEAQIAANRENATHSTGPTSDAGKAAVSQNRTVHGLNYNPETFRVLACESQAQYDALLQALRDEQNPQDTTETLLVTAMAQHRWLLDRANRLQETCFDQETAQITDQKLFSLYLRYATTHERAFHKCLNDLLKLRNHKINQQFGFESEKRKSERHQSFLELEKINHRIQYVKAYMAEHCAAQQITADEKANQAQQAA